MPGTAGREGTRTAGRLTGGPFWGSVVGRPLVHLIWCPPDRRHRRLLWESQCEFGWARWPRTWQAATGLRASERRSMSTRRAGPGTTGCSNCTTSQEAPMHHATPPVPRGTRGRDRPPDPDRCGRDRTAGRHLDRQRVTQVAIERTRYTSPPPSTTASTPRCSPPPAGRTTKGCARPSRTSPPARPTSTPPASGPRLAAHHVAPLAGPTPTTRSARHRQAPAPASACYRAAHTATFPPQDQVLIHGPPARYRAPCTTLGERATRSSYT
jgi:hypothetical protein